MFNNYEKENGKVSQYNFIKFFNIDLVRCDKIATRFILDLEHLPECQEENEFLEIFQYFLVNENDVDLLKNIDEPIFYCEELDVYVLGFTNIGTSRDYILTDVDLIQNKEGLFYPSLS